MEDEDLKDIIAGLLVVITLLVVGYVLLASSIDHSIDHQSEMLCNSAKVSGNKEYLNVCQEYYKTGDVKYMR